MTTFRLPLRLVLLAGLFVLPACTSYQLQGVVVEGRQPGIFIVSSDDPRLKQTGVADALISATLDADKLRPRSLPPATSDDYGRFAIPIEDFGAGMLEYSIQMFAEADGYGGQGSDVIALPGMGRQVLVVLSSGRRTPRKPTGTNEDLRDEAEKFKKQFE